MLCLLKAPFTRFEDGGSSLSGPRGRRADYLLAATNVSDRSVLPGCQVDAVLVGGNFQITVRPLRWR
jgi:hypothetical protein